MVGKERRKMIKKLNYDPLKDLPFFEHKVLHDKINEIIDTINKLKGGEDE